MRANLERFIAELYDDGISGRVSLEIGQHVDCSFWVRFRDISSPTSRSTPIFARDGETEMSASGPTLADALAQLDVIASR